MSEINQTKTNKRDVTLDLLRGFFLIAMTADHQGQWPSLFEYLTGQGKMWVSAAGGFVFVSGYLVGYIRGRQVRRDGMSVVTKKLLARAGKLYLVAVALAMLGVILSLVYLKIGWIPANKIDGPASGIIANILLLRYDWMDAILRLYAVVLFFSPLALWFILKGKEWLLLLLCIGMWLIGQTQPTPASSNVAHFSFLAWQLMFYGAMIVGYHGDQIKESWHSLSDTRRSVTYAVVMIAAALTLGFNIKCHIDGHLPSWLVPYQSLLFEKYRLAFGRILLFPIWFGALYMSVERFPGAFRRYLGWLLEPLGQNSLYVYTLHVTILAIVFHVPGHGLFANTLRTCIAVGILWTMVRTKFLFRIIPR